MKKSNISECFNEIEEMEKFANELMEHFKKEFPHSSQYASIYRIGVLDTINKLKDEGKWKG